MHSLWLPRRCVLVGGRSEDKPVTGCDMYGVFDPTHCAWLDFVVGGPAMPRPRSSHQVSLLVSSSQWSRCSWLGGQTFSRVITREKTHPQTPCLRGKFIVLLSFVFLLSSGPAPCLLAGRQGGKITGFRAHDFQDCEILVSIVFDLTFLERIQFLAEHLD